MKVIGEPMRYNDRAFLLSSLGRATLCDLLTARSLSLVLDCISIEMTWHNWCKVLLYL